MKLPKFLNFFKKEELTEEELFIKKKLKKIPLNRVKKSLVLYKLAKDGYILKVDEDVDNKELLKPGLEYYNGKII